MPYCMNMWRVYMLLIRIFSVFRLQPLCAFMSIYANSWINSTARQNIIWIRFGNRRAIRRRQAGAGMALTAIGKISQWGVVGCSGSRTIPLYRVQDILCSSCHWHSTVHTCVQRTGALFGYRCNQLPLIEKSPQWLSGPSPPLPVTAGSPADYRTGFKWCSDAQQFLFNYWHRLT